MADQKKASGVFAADAVIQRRLNQTAPRIGCLFRLWRVDKAHFSNTPTLNVALGGFRCARRLRSDHHRTSLSFGVRKGAVACRRNSIREHQRVQHR
jgi:hypothetical protein